MLRDAHDAGKWERPRVINVCLSSPGSVTQNNVIQHATSQEKVTVQSIED